jgi:hypothetical protein
MKVFESFNHWYDKILNSWPFCIDSESVHTTAIAWGFTEQGKYVNAIFSVRFGFPFACFVQIRWSKTRLVQFGAGWKQSGRIAVHLRFQTDASAAAGYHVGMPNNGQAQGFEFGGH